MGKINVYNKIIIGKKENRKYGSERNLYVNLRQKIGLGMEFTA